MEIIGYKLKNKIDGYSTKVGSICYDKQYFNKYKNDLNFEPVYESIEIPKEVIPEYVECIQWNGKYYISGKIYKVESNGIVLGESSSARESWKHHNFKPSTREAYDSQVKLKPIEKWSVGSYVVFLRKISNLNVGDIDRIYKESDGQCVILDKFSALNHKARERDGDVKWFATLQEAEEFSKTLLKSKEMDKLSPRFKAGDEVVFKELKDIGQLEYYNKTPEIGKKYIVSHAGLYKFDGCNGNYINIPEIYGGWIPEEAVEPYVKSDKPTECEAPKSPKITKCPFEEGNLVSCEIDGEDVHSGRIHYEDDKIYICQDVKDGTRCEDTLGYRYSWYVAYTSDDWESEAMANDVTNIEKIHDYAVCHKKSYGQIISNCIESQGLKVQDSPIQLVKVPRI